MIAKLKAFLADLSVRWAALRILAHRWLGGQ